MTNRLLVFDFDGTLTDAEQEGAEFRDPYLRFVAKRVDVNVETFLMEADGVERGLDPASDCWEFGGHIVASATLDPYLRATRTARVLVERFRPKMPAGEIETLLQEAYKTNYEAHASIAFRRGAEEMVQSLVRENTAIVTNSDTDAVRKKLGMIAGGDILLDRDAVRGNAKKYVITGEPKRVQIGMQVAGLNRPVLLRRGKYFEVLKALMNERGVRYWKNVTVVGDIFELDLALPLALGASVILLANEHTPIYERDFVHDHPRGRVAWDLDDVMRMLE